MAGRPVTRDRQTGDTVIRGYPGVAPGALRGGARLLLCDISGLSAGPDQEVSTVAAQPESASSVPASARAVLIGAGIVGNSVTHHLAQLGWGDIVLLDK